MKVSDCIARNLRRFTDTIFGITGGAIVNVFDSIASLDFRLITPNHEQAAAMMADAFSRLRSSKGQIGVVIATSGPGATNLLTGTACSYFDSIPVLIITGQVPSMHLRKGVVRQVGFQEIDVVTAFTPVTKFAARICSVDQVKSVFDAALTALFNGRGGPVLVDICDDVQRMEMDDINFEVAPLQFELDNEWEKKLATFQSYLVGAKRPVFIVGAGVKLGKCEETVLRLAKKWQIPVALTWGTLDLLDDSDTFNLRDFGIAAQRATNFVIQEADLLICLGTRLDTHETGADFSTFAPHAKKVVVDIDQSELDRLAPGVDITLRVTIEWFVHNVSHLECNFFDWLVIARSLRSMLPICPNAYYDQKSINPYAFMKSLSQVAPTNAIIVTDAGCTVVWTMQGWEVKLGQTLFTAFNNSPMGYAFPARIGAYYADSSRPIICITGDGGLNMNIQEMALLKTTNVKVFVLNNGGYGMMRQTQDTWLNSRYVATDGPFADELKVANAYDIRAHLLSVTDDLKYLDTILHSRGPSITKVSIDKAQRIEPKLVFGKSIEYSSPDLTDAQILGIRRYLNE